MVFALLRCRKGQITVCKARFWPCLINLDSGKLFLYLPQLFSLAGEEVGTARTQVSSLGMAPRCPKPSTGLPPYPHPHEQELKFSPPSQQRPANPVLRGKDGLGDAKEMGGDAKFPSPAQRRMFYPRTRCLEGRRCLWVSHALRRGAGLCPPGRMLSPLCLPLELVPPAPLAHGIPLERGQAEHFWMWGRMALWGAHGETEAQCGVSHPEWRFGQVSSAPCHALGTMISFGPSGCCCHLGSRCWWAPCGEHQAGLGWVRDRCSGPITAYGGIWRVAGLWSPLMLNSPWWRGSILECNGRGQTSLN